MSGSIDTSIPLKVSPPPNALGSGIAQAGAIGQTLGSVASGVSGLKSLRARMMAGQILATSPSIEAGLKALESNPQTAPWTTEIQSQLAGISNTLASAASTRLGQSKTIQQMFWQAAGQAIKDPTTLQASLKQTLDSVPPQLRPMAAPIMQSIETSLTTGLPKDPDAASKALQSRIIGQYMAHGGTSDSLKGILGQNIVQSRGGALVGMHVPPPQDSPELSVSSGQLPLTIPPQLVPVPGGALVPAGGAYGMGGASAAPPSIVPPQAAAVAHAEAFDGKPLDPGNIPESKVQIGINGAPILTPAQASRRDLAIKDFMSPQAISRFQNAQGSLQSIEMIKNDVNVLAKNGSFLQTGPGAPARVELANAINTLYNIVSPGSKAPFSTEQTASAASMMKETVRLGAQITNQFFGASHEAWNTISSITTSIPGIENTPLAARLLADTLEATAKRSIEERNFIRYVWMPKNHGNPDGGAEAFNLSHPAQGYAESILKRSGLTGSSFRWRDSQGKVELQPKFTTPEAIVADARSGFITADQASTYLMAQFPKAYRQQLERNRAAGAKPNPLQTPPASLRP